MRALFLLFQTVGKKSYLRTEKELIAFGKHLRSIRESKNITMEVLADMCKIDYTQISRIERGIISTGLSQVFTIANALEVPYKDLFDFEVKQ